MKTNLAEFGMYEHQGVLVQDLENGTAMQVKLAPDRIDVRWRSVPVALINETDTDTPAWTTAYGFNLATWVTGNSPVFRWLKEKGINEVAMHKRQLGLK
jgi:hypothetical protein